MTLEVDGWMPIAQYCAAYGERRNTIHARISTGLWQRGVHYAKPDGSAGFVHVVRAQEWVEAEKQRKLSVKQKPAPIAAPEDVDSGNSETAKSV